MRLLTMLESGAFPIEGAPIPPRRGAPRVGDGVIELDEAGIGQWASPNARSACHRFGVGVDRTGSSLAELATELLQSRSPVDESLPLVLMGRAAWRSDMQARGGTLSLRAVPLTESGARTGAMVLVRDVTEQIGRASCREGVEEAGVGVTEESKGGDARGGHTGVGADVLERRRAD